MGWATGSMIMSAFVDELEDSSLGHTQRVLVYELLIDTFENYDCDTLDECIGSDSAFDEAWVNTGHTADIEDDYEEDEEE